jgi:release factor glutamine methyltransferase
MLTAESLGALLRRGADSLEEAGLSRAWQDAEWLLAGLLGFRRSRLPTEPDRPVVKAVAKRFLALIDRRRSGEPLQYLLGWEEFRGLRLRVTPAALIPRPETELLVEWALEVLSERRCDAEPLGPPRLVVDLGTGSGAIALALAAACPGVTIYAVDLAPGAVALARENASALGLADRVQLLQGDLFAPLGPLTGAVDLMISNPPYIPAEAIQRLPAEVRDYEPHEALDGGPEGMTFHRKIIAGAPSFLRREGWLLLEMGENHSGPLGRLLAATGFQEIEVRKDLSGADRMIGARWQGRGAEGGAGDGSRGAEGGAGDGSRGAEGGAGDDGYQDAEKPSRSRPRTLACTVRARALPAPSLGGDSEGGRAPLPVN